MFSAAVLAMGWLIGLAIGSRMAEFWAGCGGVIGAVTGAEIGLKRHLIDARWSRTLNAMPILGFVSVGGLALYNRFPSLLVAFTAVIGAGLGALLAKYLMEFFNYEPPPSIL